MSISPRLSVTLWCGAPYIWTHFSWASNCKWSFMKFLGKCISLSKTTQGIVWRIIWPEKEHEKTAKMNQLKRKLNWTKFMMTNIKRNYSLPLRLVSKAPSIILFLEKNPLNGYFSRINRKSTNKIWWTTFTDGIGKFVKEKNVALSKQTISKVNCQKIKIL